MRGDLMHMLGWFFYYIRLTWHAIVTFGPLEGVLVCLCRSLTGERLIVKAQGHLDLHLGNKYHRLDDLTPLLSTYLMRDVSFGGT
jgi:hypothetical protein